MRMQQWCFLCYDTPREGKNETLFCGIVFGFFHGCLLLTSVSQAVVCEAKWENLSRRAGEEAQKFRKPQYFGQATRRVKLIIL